MKELLKKTFPELIALRNRIFNYLAHYRFKGKSPEHVFSLIHQENHWKDDESKSGTGSSEKSTVEVMGILNQVLRDFNIRTMLDIPCGDFNWMLKVNFAKVEYTGGDIVPALIDHNTRSYSGQRRSFNKMDILTSPLPKFDLIFTRDCLVHFSYSDIKDAIKNIKKSGSLYWLTTTFPEHNNYDIITGDWRPINLARPPFNLPSPLEIYSEKCMEDDRYFDKSLAIWKVSDL